MAASRCSRLLFIRSRLGMWDSLKSSHKVTRSVYYWQPRVCSVNGVRSVYTSVSRMQQSKAVESSPGMASSDSATRAAEYRLNRSYLGRFWDWLTEVPQDEPEMAEGEKQEREELLQRVESMYFSDPPVTPDLNFYKEVFTCLVKYEDRIGCKQLWNVMTELGVQPDEELSALVEPFLDKSWKNAWFE